MMRAVRAVVTFLLVATTRVAPCGAQSIEEQWVRMSRPGTLAVSVRLLDEHGRPLGEPTVDDIVVFEITLDPADRGPWAVIDAVNGQPHFVSEQAALPLHINRNMRGKAPGVYTISIGVEDALGRTGRADVDLWVLHE